MRGRNGSVYPPGWAAGIGHNADRMLNDVHVVPQNAYRAPVARMVAETIRVTSA